MIQGQYRQGDVLLDPVPSLPDGAKPEPETDNLILAAGEMTGHHHRLIGKFRAFQHQGERFLQVLESCNFGHEEHDHHVVVPGTYRVRLQTENWLGEATRVLD